MTASPDIAIVGGGIGGLTAAIALSAVGLRPRVFEQTSHYARVGADINLTPNAVRALDGLSGAIGAALREHGAQPRWRISRTWDTGAETSRLPLAEHAENAYGAPQVTLHRADLMAALARECGDVDIELGRRVQSVQLGARPTIHFADGTSHSADLVIGADGIHSRVRDALLGPEHPTYTGVVAFRAVIAAESASGLPNADSFTKWWGPDPSTQIVTFPLGHGEIFVFATIAQPEWAEESWTTSGTVAELSALYSGFHAEARLLLERCGSVLKSALYVREPLDAWTDGQAVVLLGDAAHPMMPFMAQGAGQAIEDAVVLARHLSAGTDIGEALRAFERARLTRTAAIQRGSRGNEWLKEAGNADWVYGYDAWREPLAAKRSGGTD